MEPEKLNDSTIEELVQAYAELSIKEDELAAEKSVLKEEIISRMKGDAMIVGSYTVNKIKRVMFKTSLDDARSLGAVKEAIDTEVLKKLHQNGVTVPGSSITTYVQIRELAVKE